MERTAHPTNKTLDEAELETPAALIMRTLRMRSMTLSG